MLTREERSKINKSNRRRGYNVERDDVLFHRKNKIFAFRIQSRQQRGDLATWDVVVCKKEGVEVHQCKYHKKLLKPLERENHIRTVTYYGLIPVLCWRDYGLKWERMI